MKSLPFVHHCRVNVFLPPGYYFKQQWVKHLGELTRKFQNCEMPVLQKCFPHTFREFWYHQGCLATTVFVMHIDSAFRIALTIVWPYWNLTVDRRQNQYCHFLLALCNNYCHRKTETALHYSHILPLYYNACTFLSEGRLTPMRRVASGHAAQHVAAKVSCFKMDQVVSLALLCEEAEN